MILNGINIKEIQHKQYKERYFFVRNNESAVIDFEYNSNGFYGRVVPIQNITNSRILLSDIYSTLNILKNQEYAS